MRLNIQGELSLFNCNDRGFSIFQTINLLFNVWIVTIKKLKIIAEWNKFSFNIKQLRAVWEVWKFLNVSLNLSEHQSERECNALILSGISFHCMRCQYREHSVSEAMVLRTYYPNHSKRWYVFSIHWNFYEVLGSEKTFGIINKMILDFVAFRCHIIVILQETI